MSSHSKRYNILRQLEQSIRCKTIQKHQQKYRANSSLLKKSPVIGSSQKYRKVDKLSRNLNSNPALRVNLETKSKTSEFKVRRFQNKMFDKLVALITYAINSADKIIRYIDFTTNFEAEFSHKLYQSDRANLLSELNNISLDDFGVNQRIQVPPKLTSDRPKTHKYEGARIKYEGSRINYEGVKTAPTYQATKPRLIDTRTKLSTIGLQIENEKLRQQLILLEEQFLQYRQLSENSRTSPVKTNVNGAAIERGKLSLKTTENSTKKLAELLKAIHPMPQVYSYLQLISECEEIAKKLNQLESRSPAKSIDRTRKQLEKVLQLKQGEQDLIKNQLITLITKDKKNESLKNIWLEESVALKQIIEQNIYPYLHAIRDYSYESFPEALSRYICESSRVEKELRLANQKLELELAELLGDGHGKGLKAQEKSSGSKPYRDSSVSKLHDQLMAVTSLNNTLLKQNEGLQKRLQKCGTELAILLSESGVVNLAGNEELEDLIQKTEGLTSKVRDSKEQPQRQKRIEQLIQAKRGADKQIDVQIAKIKELQDLLQIMAKNQAQILEQLTEKEAKLKQHQQHNQENRLRLKDLLLQNELKDTQLASKDRQIQSMLAESDKKDKSINTLQQVIDSSNRQYSKLAEKKKEIEQQLLKEIQKNAEDSRQSDQSKQIKQLKEALESKQEHIDAQQERINIQKCAVQDKKTKLEHTSHQISQLQEQLDRKGQQLSDMEKQLSNKEQELTHFQLRTQIQALAKDTQIKQLKQQCGSYLQQVEIMDKQIHLLEEVLSEKDSQQQLLKQQQVQLQTNRKILKKQLQSKQAIIIEMSQQIRQQVSINQKQEEQIDELNKHIDQIKNKTAQLEDNKRTEDQQKAQKQHQNSLSHKSLQTQLSQLSLQLIQKDQIINQLQQQKKKQQEILINASNSYKQLHDKSKEIKRELQDLKQSNETHKDSNKNLKEIIAEKEAQVSQSATEYMSKIEQLSLSNSELAAKQQQLQHQNSTLKQQIQEMQQISQHREQTWTKRQEQLSKQRLLIKLEKQNQIQQLNDKIKCLQGQKMSQNLKNSQYNQNSEQKQQQLEQYKKKRDDSAHKLDQVLTQLVEAEAEINHKSQIIRRLESKIELQEVKSQTASRLIDRKEGQEGKRDIQSEGIEGQRHSLGEHQSDQVREFNFDDLEEEKSERMCDSLLPEQLINQSTRINKQIKNDNQSGKAKNLSFFESPQKGERLSDIVSYQQSQSEILNSGESQVRENQQTIQSVSKARHSTPSRIKQIQGLAYNPKLGSLNSPPKIEVLFEVPESLQNEFNDNSSIENNPINNAAQSNITPDPQNKAQDMIQSAKADFEEFGDLQSEKMDSSMISEQEKQAVLNTSIDKRDKADFDDFGDIQGEKMGDSIISDYEETEQKKQYEEFKDYEDSNKPGQSQLSAVNSQTEQPAELNQSNDQFDMLSWPIIRPPSAEQQSEQPSDQQQ